MRMYFLPILALVVSASAAQADSKSYCEIYAKDFASAKTSDVDQWQQMYRNSYSDCMQQYGASTTETPKAEGLQKPKPVAQKKRIATIKAPEKTAEPAVGDAAAQKTAANAAMQEGSDEWNTYCAKKYVSFNKETGTYKSRTGKVRHCVVSP